MSDFTQLMAEMIANARPRQEQSGSSGPRFFGGSGGSSGMGIKGSQSSAYAEGSIDAGKISKLFGWMSPEMKKEKFDQMRQGMTTLYYQDPTKYEEYVQDPKNQKVLGKLKGGGFPVTTRGDGLLEIPVITSQERLPGLSRDQILAGGADDPRYEPPPMPQGAKAGMPQRPPMNRNPQAQPSTQLMARERELNAPDPGELEIQRGALAVTAAQEKNEALRLKILEGEQGALPEANRIKLETLRLDQENAKNAALELKLRQDMLANMPVPPEVMQSLTEVMKQYATEKELAVSNEVLGMQVPGLYANTREAKIERLDKMSSAVKKAIGQTLTYAPNNPEAARPYLDDLLGMAQVFARDTPKPEQPGRVGKFFGATATNEDPTFKEDIGGALATISASIKRMDVADYSTISEYAKLLADDRMGNSDQDIQSTLMYLGVVEDPSVIERVMKEIGRSYIPFEYDSATEEVTFLAAPEPPSNQTKNREGPRVKPDPNKKSGIKPTQSLMEGPVKVNRRRKKELPPRTQSHAERINRETDVRSLFDKR